MDKSVELEKRVSVLEAEMSWASGTVHDIKRDLQSLKEGQYRILEWLTDFSARSDLRISGLQTRTDERFQAFQAHTDERFQALQAHTDERFQALQAHTDDRISKLQAHVDEKFIGVHHEISSIHKAITTQTKWILAVILGSATILSILIPVMQRLL